MDDKKEKLVLDGNAFYELDMECLKNKQKKLQREKERNAEKDSINCIITRKLLI